MGRWRSSAPAVGFVHVPANPRAMTLAAIARAIRAALDSLAARPA